MRKLFVNKCISVFYMLTCLFTCILTCTCREPVLCLQQLARGLSLPHPQAVEMVTVLSTFCVLFNLYLTTLHDAEFYREKEGQLTHVLISLMS